MLVCLKDLCPLLALPPLAKFIPRPLIGSEKGGTTNTDPSSPWARSTVQTSKPFVTPCLCKDTHSTSSPYCSSSCCAVSSEHDPCLEYVQGRRQACSYAPAALMNDANSIAVTMPFARLCFRCCCNEYGDLGCSHRVNRTIVNRISRMTITPAPP